MKNNKKLIKKTFFKVLTLISVFSVFFSVLIIPTSADSNVYQTKNLNEFFAEQRSGSIQFIDVGPDEPSLWGEGLFQSNAPSGVGQYTCVGNFKNTFSFNSSQYYTINFPLSFNTDYININSVTFDFIDSNGQVYAFERVNSIWPDPVAQKYSEDYFVTYFFEATFSGALLVELKNYRLKVSGNNWSGNGDFFSGIVRDRYITITTTSKTEHDLVYGDPNTDYNQPSSQPQDDLHQIEQELINEHQMGNIAEFFGSQGNGGNSIVNITNGLQAASVLFSELFNNNGRRYTIFSMLINFSLTLGLVCLLLNLAPKVFSGNSSSKNRAKNKDKSKGGNKK